MKKFRFLIFMLILASIFIGCAQPTDDTTEAELTNDQLYSLVKQHPADDNDAVFFKNFTIKSSNRKFTINTTLLDNTEGLSIEYLNKNYTILIKSWPNYPDYVNISVPTNDTSVTDAKTIITNNIKQIYVEVE